jgi:hypothetical protein
MTRWHASYEHRLTAAGLTAAVAVESASLRLELSKVVANVEAGMAIGLDTSG